MRSVRSVLFVLVCACGLAASAVGAAAQSEEAASSSPPPSEEFLDAGDCRPGVMAASVCATRGLAAWRGVPYTPPVTCSALSTCQILMDIYAPTDPGPWPLVVVVPGANMDPDSVKTYIDDFALLVADEGAVVMTAEWRQGGSDPQEGIGDVSCAIGVGRQTGPLYGADPERVVLVGHSLGVRPVIGAALTRAPNTPEPATCDATSGSLRPDAAMVIAGLYDLVAAAGLAAAVSPEERIPVVVAQGGADEAANVEAARGLQAVLEGGGWDSTLIEVPSADHPGILYEQATIDAVMGLTAAR